MGLFDRRKTKELKRDTEIYSGQPENEEYVPHGLSFLINRKNVDPVSISAFFSGVEMIANSIAEIPVYVRDAKSKEIVEHSFVDALHNASISKFVFMKMLIWDLYTKGQAFAYIRRSGNEIKELVYYSPSEVNVYFDSVSHKIYYQINGFSNYVEPVNLIHIYKNSLDGYVGKGIPFFAGKVLEIASNTDSTALDFFKAGANVNGILKSSKMMDTEQKEEAYNSWVSAFSHKSAGANIAVLGNDWEYKQVGINNADAEMLSSREFNVLEICRYLNISPALLGIKSATAYGNIEQAQLDFIIHTLLPLITMLEDEFNRKIFLKDDRKKFKIDFDEDKIMFSDKQSTGNYYTSLVKNGIISINEARTALGYVPKKGADDLVIPYTNINNNKVNKGGEGEEKEPEEEENKDK